MDDISWLEAEALRCRRAAALRAPGLRRDLLQEMARCCEERAAFLRRPAAEAA